MLILLLSRSCVYREKFTCCLSESCWTQIWKKRY